MVSGGHCLHPSNAESRIFIQLTAAGVGGDEECGEEGNSQGLCCVRKGPHVFVKWAESDKSHMQHQWKIYTI